MKSTKVKHRRFGNKKTRRINRRGGMHKPTPKEFAEAHAKKREGNRKDELAAAHKVLLQKMSGVSSKDRMAVLTTGTGALAGHMSDKLLHRHDPWLLRMNSREPLLVAAKPHASLPAMLDAAGMFQQAEQLCLQVRQLPDADMWTRKWGSMTCGPMAKSMCAEAVALYKGATERKYLPAYAPLAWMISHSYPDESLKLCDACIAACDARISAPFAKEAKTDCTALRAFVQCEKFMSDQEFMEGLAPGGHMEYEVSAKPPMKELKKIESHSIRNGSKYGYALRWQLLTFPDVLDDWTSELMTMMPAKAAETEKAEEARTIAEGMGLDFERCRFCFKF